MEKYSLKFIIATTIILIISSAISSNAISQELGDKNITYNGEIADWTVMYYMCSDLSFFSKDPAETAENLSRIGSTDGLNIVVMKDSYGLGNTELYEINDTGAKILLNEKYGWPDEVNTGNTNTLIQFCKLMMNDYPAKYYSLVLVAPGTAGWIVRSLHDSNGVRGPSWPQFGEAMKEITDDGNNKIDVIFIESCVLGLIENAYEISPYVNYMICSEEHIPDGIECVQRYYEPLWDLKNNTKFIQPVVQLI